MSDLNETKAWMSWWGWTFDGGPGSVKMNTYGLPIAFHRDQVWHADVEKAYQLARAERSRLAHPASAPGEVTPPPQ